MAWAAIEPETGMLAIGAQDSEHQLAKQIPGCNYAEGDRIWRVPLSWPAYVALRTAWGTWPLAESGELQAWAASAWKDVQLAYGLRSMMDAPAGIASEIDAIELGDENWQSDLKLRFYQRGGVAWLVTQRKDILADPMGNGKTPVVIRAVQVLKRRGELDGKAVLIIARGSALYNWRDEFAAWAPELTVRVVSGTALRRGRALAEQPLADVYVMSWPVVRMHSRLAHYAGTRFVRCKDHGGTDEVTVGRCEVHEKELNALPLAVVVADEAHAMSDASSKQTRAVSWLGQRAAYFWPVTGTPVGDTIEDFWPLAHAIDPKAFPAKGRFLQMFALQDYAWGSGKTVLGLRPDNEAAFHVIAQPMMRRIPKELARPEQPPRLPAVFRYPELKGEQARMYKQLVRESLADVAPGTLMVPDNTAVKFGRLCQLAAAAIKITEFEGPDGFPAERVELGWPSPKVDDLLEFLDDAPGQLIVSANMPGLIAMAEQKLNDRGITHCKIIGGMSPEDKHNANRWFQDGQCRVIFLTPTTGGESINLTAASTVFFLQPNPSFRATDQVICRADRMGQEFPVSVVYSVTRGTVEQRLYDLSTGKAERAGQITRDPDLMRWMLTGTEEDDQDVQLRLV